MFKVIVIDDEMLVRKRIIYGFDWKALGYEIEDDVDNGADALKLMETKLYDLAIVDIAMPDMNGIELTQRIRERNLPIYIIFLTGHSDFQYAQKAIRYGAYYYILKPINEDEFIHTLVKLADKMKQEEIQNRLFRQLSENQSKANTVVESDFYNRWFHMMGNGVDEIEISEQLRRGGLREGGYYFVLVYCVEKTQENQKIIIDRDRENVTEYLQHTVIEGTSLIIYDNYDDYVIIIKETEQYTPDNTLYEFALKINREAEDLYDAPVYCGFSTLSVGYLNLLKCYKEAISALNNTKIMGSAIVNYRCVEEREGNHYKVSSIRTKDLQYYMGKCNYQECKDVIQELFAEMMEKEVNYECVVQNSNRLLLDISDTAAVSGLEIRQFMNGFNNLEAALNNIREIDGIVKWFNEIIYNLIESKLWSASTGKNLPIVEKACDYIRYHYNDMELTQIKIADELFVTPSYISGLFKKIIGMSMMQYITMIRLEKAKEILMNGDFDIHDVAEQVGYSDEYYFSRCFKKYFGISPSHVKKIKSVNQIKQI